jgi:predicted MFS family arabinose efflux permease
MIMISIYTHMGPTSLTVLIVINVIMFSGIMSRMIPATALTSGIPQPQDRGAYMSVNSSVQQVSGGIASVIAGHIIVENADKSLAHFDTVGYVTLAAMVVAAVIMYFVNRQVVAKVQHTSEAKPAGEALAT